jgi:hypothetical protein
MSDESDSSDEPASGPDGTRLPPPEILELDAVYEALGHPRRRYLCYTLLESTEWSLTELATKMAAWERGAPEHAVTAEERERMYVSLYHAHVPKLVDDGVVAFDEATGRITAAEHADQVLAALEGMGASLDADQETHARGEMDEREG